MISAAPRSTGQVTLITGLLGSGKTWSLTSQLLQAAKACESASSHESTSGSLLALSRPAECAALQERVDLDRPLGCAKCDVLTFPSLVRRIVRDFGPTVGSYLPNDETVLNRSALAVFLHHNLDALPLGKYRPLHDPGDAVWPLLKLFSGLAHCGVSPEEYLRYVDSLETELLETASSSVVSDDEAEAVASGTPASASARARIRARAQLEAEGWRSYVAGERDKANSYEAFVALKRKRGVTDFSDQLLLARRVLKESATAKAAMSLRLAHIFVDDLQDYSPAMVDVIAGLVGPGVGITAAVDPFLSASGIASKSHALGTELTAMARFKAEFPGAHEIRLIGNRHSTDAIQVAMQSLKPLEAPVRTKPPYKAKVVKAARKSDKLAAADVPDAAADAADAAAAAAAEASSFAALDETVASTSSEVTAATLAAGGSRLTCLTFRTEVDEVKALGRRIRGLIDGGLSPDEIGVAVFGGQRTADALVAALSATGVPVNGPPRACSVFDCETPRMLMSFLRCLIHPSESTPLLHLLMACPAYSLPGGELTAALEGHLSRYVPLRSFLRDSQLGEERDKDPRQGGVGVSTSARKVAERLLFDVSRFAETAKRKGVREIMRDFLVHTGQLERLEEPTTLAEEQEGRAVAMLFELTTRAEEQAGGDNVVLVEPVLRLFRRHGTGYANTSLFDDDQPTTGDDPETNGGQANDERGAVRVFQPGRDERYGEPSYFDTVFVPFCSRTRLPGNLHEARLPIPAPFRGDVEPRDSASLRAGADLERARHENRARAKLYTALGSARRQVFLSVSARINRRKTHLNPSPFLFEILGAHAPHDWAMTAAGSKEAREEGDGSEDSVSRRVANPGASGDVGGRDAKAVSPVPPQPMVPLRLSYSSISSLAACPYSYYLQHVLNVSPPPNPRMVYGRAMHEGVAAFLRGTASDAGGGLPPTLEAVVEDFNRHLSGCAFESAAQLRSLRAAGVAGLESFMSRLNVGRCDDASGLGGGDPGSKRDSRLQRQLLVERKFVVKVPEADVILSGIFDRVDVALPSEAGAESRQGSIPQLLSITDYKSNVGAKDPARIVRGNLQLQVYALAAERLFGAFPTELAIESIEDGRRGAMVPSRADVEAALGAISTTAAAVRAEQFDATPSFQACTFCGFKHMCRHSVITSAAL